MKRRAVFGAVVLSLALCSTASAQFTPGARTLNDRLLPTIGNGGYDAQHYDLTINYDPVANTMVSSTDITIRATQALSEFSLDLHRNLTVAGVTIDGVAATVARDADKLIVTPAAGIANNRVFHAVVSYSGTPVQIQDPDGSFEGWVRITNGGFVDQRADGRDGLVPEQQPPQGQGDVRLPHHGARRTHTALGNGELVVEGRQRRPHVDVELAHGRADGELPEHVHGRPVRLPRPCDRCPRRARRRRAAVGKSGSPLEIYNAFETRAEHDAEERTRSRPPTARTRIVKFISDEIGAPYPFESHGVVLHRNPLGYALEVQTKSHFSGTSIGALARSRTRSRTSGSANTSRPSTWSDLWFNEGWATWWAWYWSNKQNNIAHHGRAAVHEQLQLDDAADALEHAARRCCRTRRRCSTRSRSTRARRMMLEAYRQIVGDRRSSRSSARCSTEHGCGDINAAEFIALAKRIARDRAGFEASNLAKLDMFFQQWIYGAASRR